MADVGLDTLVSRLTRRKRRVRGAQGAVDGLLFAGVAVLIVATVDLFTNQTIDGPVILAAVLAAGLVLGYIAGSSTSVDPYRTLLETDHAYRTHEQLATAYELAESGGMAPFASAVARQAAELGAQVDPRELYRLRVHRRYLLIPAILLAAVIVSGLETITTAGGDPIVQLGGAEIPSGSGQAPVEPDTPERGDLGLTEELENSSDRDGREEETGDATEDPQEQADQVEEQVRELARESLADDDIALGEDAEEAVRGALRRGMSEQEIQDIITQMRDQGESTADIVDELEEGSSQIPPDANTGREVDEQAVDDLTDQLLPVPPSQDESAEDSEGGQNDTSEPTQGGETDVTPGEDAQTGDAQGTDEERPTGEDIEQPQTEGEEQAPNEGASDEGGRTPVPDASEDDFSPTNDSRIAAELTGKVVEETFLNLVIRDLPREAVSQLEDLAPDVRYARAVEEAIAQERIPPEAAALVRNYFLRIARRTAEGADE